MKENISFFCDKSIKCSVYLNAFCIVYVQVVTPFPWNFNESKATLSRKGKPRKHIAGALCKPVAAFSEGPFMMREYLL